MRNEKSKSNNVKKEEEYITNPDTNRKVKRNGLKGKEITERYGGMPATTTAAAAPIFCFRRKIKSTKPTTKQPTISSVKSQPPSSLSPAFALPLSQSQSQSLSPLCISLNKNSCNTMSSYEYRNVDNSQENIDNPIMFLYHMLESFQNCLHPNSRQIFLNICIQNGSPPKQPPNTGSTSGDCEFDLEFEPALTTTMCEGEKQISICRINKIIPNCIENSNNTLATNKEFLNNILKEILEDILKQLCAELQNMTNVNVLSLFQGVIASLMIEAIVDMCNDMCNEIKSLPTVCNNKYAKISGNVILKMKIANPSQGVNTIVKTIA